MSAATTAITLALCASREFLRLMTVSREADLREGICFRQGKGWFELAGAGHEAIAAAALALRPADFLFPYYRDRALLLARGTPLYDLALGYFAKAASSSGGRQMANHYSDAARRVFSYASPTGLQFLPAAGAAWACRLAGNQDVVVCCTGEAAVSQGEFYEALRFAVQERLPLIFLVEDNGYGVSTPTGGMNPYQLGVLSSVHLLQGDGRDPLVVFEKTAEAVRRAREGLGPSVLWFEIDRLQSHSSSDDQRLYRDPAELAAMLTRDPLLRFEERLIAEGRLDGRDWVTEKDEIRRWVDETYRCAEVAPDPDPDQVLRHRYSPQPLPAARATLPAGTDITLVAAINHTLHHLLAVDPRVLLFGEDIEDPKGGVFGMTKGLSHAFPGRVVNAPLAEASIAGLAAGLAAAGKRPIFELQFVDFAGPALNQIINQIATLRWRTAGAWTCPSVLLAPCGAYLPAGGPWHSQTNEGWFAHVPGLQIAVPATPGDAAGLLRASAAGEDPVLLLLPKHLFRQRVPIPDPAVVRLGEARICRSGSDVTVVAWGNCVELAMEAAEMLAQVGVDVEVLDLRSIVPCDWDTIRISLEKTGRLVVVQEDNRTCSFGQAIVSEVVTQREFWNLLAAPPQLLSRPDVGIGFHPLLEEYVLPQVAAICETIVDLVEDC